MAEGTRTESVYTATYRGSNPLTAIFKEELVRNCGFSHFICLYGSELVIGRQDPRQFLSCLYGSEPSINPHQLDVC